MKAQKTRLLKYGLEIEGEFSYRTISKLKALDCVMVNDGSVDACVDIDSNKDEEHDFGGDDYEVYEMNTRPIPVNNYGLDKFNKIIEALGSYGRDFHSNETAGFHIHFSFKPQLPPELFYSGFLSAFYKAVAAKYPVAWEDRKDNTYCEAIDFDDEQIEETGEEDDRYKGVNLYPAINKHGTIEFRLWPSDTPEMMSQYFYFTLNFIKKYLEQEHKIELSEIKNKVFNSKGLKNKYNIKLSI